ncbi:hypothetical protein [Denitromonas iodatirespirans]|uniref:Uncharacterized protein n=1 Tax=Denitromonas iodatirespirans TaxID=2795389 RepID=A0A944DC54_DENI1|nr:hypothetical protein [Denitromonas iodatirespirans]MBT0962371.1 hypothetical protein [Denitromonas iodatirespirans]
MRHSERQASGRGSWRLLGIGLLSLIGLSSPAPARAAACEVPDFTPQTPGPDRAGTGFPLNIGASLRATVPTGFERLRFSSHAIVLGYPGGGSAVIGLETAESIAVIGAGTSPADFYRNVFSGADTLGCEVLAGLGLATMDYRITQTRGKVKIFAYGQGTTHQFYAISDDTPQVVVGGRFTGVDRTAFDDILSSIAPL